MRGETGLFRAGLLMKTAPIGSGDDGTGLELAVQVRNGSCCRSLADGLKEGSRWKQRFSMLSSCCRSLSEHWLRYGSSGGRS